MDKIDCGDSKNIFLTSLGNVQAIFFDNFIILQSNIQLFVSMYKYKSLFKEDWG